MKAKTRRKGFTLLELLMVVIIIAILAAVALPQFLRVTERAQSSQALSYLGTIRSAELRYSAEHAVYTATLTDLDIVPVGGAFKVPPSWTDPADLANISAAGVEPVVGFASVTRAGTGGFAGKTLGLQYGTGTVCGDFVPYDAAIPLCAQD